MGTPMTPDQLVNALRAEGLRVVTVGEWRTHNRNHRGAWGPINGAILHHTVSRGDQASVQLCYNGYEGLPGPLCQVVITKDGTAHVISAGRANHAGGGDPNVLQAVIDERYITRPPVPQVGNIGGVDGNSRFYGAECVNMGDGVDPWPDVQVDAMVRFGAAISRHYGWTEKSVIGHKEWSKDKNDPRGPGDTVAMPVLRERIKERLAHPASWNPSGAGTPTPSEQGPDTMATKPDRQMLNRTEDTALIPNSALTLYWTGEGQDDGSGHSDGGKTMATNVCYSTVVSLKLTGITAAETVEVFVVEEDANGDPFTSGVPAEVNGIGDGTGTVWRDVSIIGVATQRITVRVVNKGSQVGTLLEARAASQYWPNA